MGKHHAATVVGDQFDNQHKNRKINRKTNISMKFYKPKYHFISNNYIDHMIHIWHTVDG